MPQKKTNKQKTEHKGKSQQQQQNKQIFVGQDKKLYSQSICDTLNKTRNKSHMPILRHEQLKVA